MLAKHWWACYFNVLALILQWQWEHLLLLLCIILFPPQPGPYMLPACQDPLWSGTTSCPCPQPHWWNLGAGQQFISPETPSPSPDGQQYPGWPGIFAWSISYWCHAVSTARSFWAIWGMLKIVKIPSKEGENGTQERHLSLSCSSMFWAILVWGTF